MLRLKGPDACFIRSIRATQHLLQRQSYTTRSKSRFLQVSDEVQEALNSRKPVVALETTIYTHGFPYPENIALSNHLESLVRQNGAVPATIGVLNGVAKVGMSEEDMTELLEKADKGLQTVKLSRRDIGWICGQGTMGRDVNGGTTIAGTMVLAHLAGIQVFATGGLGGVHKGGEHSMDVSADLTELGRTPVALVSSGCKSFLDIGRTLEYLETQGVGVGTFADGRTGHVDFPAFWTRESGIPSPRTISDEVEAAAIIQAQFSLPIHSGLLFANPIAEEFSLAKEYMDSVMARAVEDANTAGKFGHENTPFVLGRIREITEGSTIAANRELVAANVARGAKVASELAKMQSNTFSASFVSTSGTDELQTNKHKGRGHVDTLVIGCLALDLTGDYSGSRQSPALGTSNPGKFRDSLGGVGGNIAKAVAYAGASVRLFSLVGDDLGGTSLLHAAREAGLNVSLVQVMQDHRTARYVAFNDKSKDLTMAMADMSIFEQSSPLLDKLFYSCVKDLNPSWLALDANWSAETIQKWLAFSKQQNIKTAFEPVSEEKSARLFQSGLSRRRGSAEYLINLTTPNGREVKAMRDALHVHESERDHMAEWRSLCEAGGFLQAFSGSTAVEDKASLADAAADALQMAHIIETQLVTLGREGILLVQSSVDDIRGGVAAQGKGGRSTTAAVLRNGQHRVLVQHFPIPEKIEASEVISVNGVGDTLLGVVLAGVSRGRQLDQRLLDTAQRAAALTLRSTQSVNPTVKTLADELVS